MSANKEEMNSLPDLQQPNVQEFMVEISAWARAQVSEAGTSRDNLPLDLGISGHIADLADQLFEFLFEDNIPIEELRELMQRMSAHRQITPS